MSIDISQHRAAQRISLARMSYDGDVYVISDDDGDEAIPAELSSPDSMAPGFKLNTEPAPVPPELRFAPPAAAAASAAAAAAGPVLSSRDDPRSNEYVDPTLHEFQCTQFIKSDALDDLACAVCMGVAFKDPIQLECPHRLCKVCAEGLVAALPRYAPDTFTCPMCRSVNSSDIKVDKYIVDRVLPRLKVQCNYAGCNEIYEYGARGTTEAAHRARCEYRLVNCPFHSEHQVAKGKLDAHAATCSHRMVQCAACEKEMRIGEIDAHAADTRFGPCGSFKPCPNGCKEETSNKRPRVTDAAAASAAAAAAAAAPGPVEPFVRLAFKDPEELRKHLESCPNRVEQCALCPAGSTYRLCDKVAHHRRARTAHAMLLMDEMLGLKAGFEELKRRFIPEPVPMNMRCYQYTVLPVKADRLSAYVHVPFQMNLPGLSRAGDTFTVGMQTRGTRRQGGRMTIEFALRAPRHVSAASRIDERWGIRVSQLELARDLDSPQEPRVEEFNVRRTMDRRDGAPTMHAFVTCTATADVAIDIGSLIQFNYADQYQNSNGCIGLLFELFRRDHV